MKLFRQEAIEHKAGAFATSTTMVSPPGYRAYTLLIGSLAIGISLFVLLGRYAPKDTVRGYVSTTTGDVEVYSQSDGTILELSVTEGQSVVPGQELLVLSTARSIGQSAGARKQIIGALRSELEDLRIQIQSEHEGFDLQEKAVAEEIVSLRARLQKLVDQRQVLQAGLELAERELARLTALDATQFVSDADQDRARASTIEFRLRLHDLDLSVDALQSDIRRNQQLLQEIPVRRKARAAELRAESRRLSIAVTENMGREMQRVLAPSAGVVSGLLVREGQTISMSNPLLNIVPEDGEFFAELLIPSRTIGFVRAGATVKIRFDAYPYQKFGTFNAVIESLARTTVLPTDKRFRVPLSEPVYLAAASMATQFVDVDGNAQPLQSGMTLTADILRDERSILAWIFDPLIGATERL